MVGSGYREPPALARRGDGQTFQLTPLLYLVLSAVDGRRDLRRGGRAGRRGLRPAVTRGQRAHARRRAAAPARPAGQGRRQRSRRSRSRTRCWRCVQVRRHRPGAHPPAHRAVRPAVQPGRRRPGGAGVPGRVLVGVLGARGWPRRRTRRSTSPACCCSWSRSPCCRRGSTSSATRPPPAAAAPRPGVMGAGHLPGLAGVLHRRHRLLPARSRRPGPHRPRRAVLQRDRRGRDRRRLVGHRVRRAAAGRGHPDPADGAAADAAGPLRRLPRARRRHRRPRPVPPDQADPARRCCPGAGSDPEARVLKPWARAVVTLWVLVVVPMLAFSLFTMVVTLPRMLGTAWASVGAVHGLLGRAWSRPTRPRGRRRAVHRDRRRRASRSWRIGRVLVRLRARIGGAAVAPHRAAGRSGAPLAGLVAAAWSPAWPGRGGRGRARYRPIQPYEGGTSATPVGLPRPALRARRRLAAGQRGTVVHRLGRRRRRGPPASTRSSRWCWCRRPAQAQVAAGRYRAPATTAPSPGCSRSTSRSPPGRATTRRWRSTPTDNTVRYDVAFALVWVERRLARAEHATRPTPFASCTNCAAVAVGFQVVLVTGDNHVAVPQNISGGGQLRLRQLPDLRAGHPAVRHPRRAAQRGRARAAGAAVAPDREVRHRISGEVPWSKIRSRLEAYKQQILEIIVADEPGC